MTDPLIRSAAPAPTSSRRRHGPQCGFTLLELMVVTVIIGILAAIALPMYQRHVLQGNLQRAEPYLKTIAAKQRIHFNRYGSYYYNSDDNADFEEAMLESALGVDLSDAADFCFQIICTNVNANCIDDADVQQSSGGTYLNQTANDAPEFEIWAILRETPAPLNGVPPAIASPVVGSCVPTTNNKLDPTGWVADTTTGGRGSEGRAVVLSYPPPDDGFGTQVTVNGRAITPFWRDGVTYTDAMED